MLWLIDSDCFAASNERLCFAESVADLTADKLWELWLLLASVEALLWGSVFDWDPWLALLAWLALAVSCLVVEAAWEPLVLVWLAGFAFVDEVVDCLTVFSLAFCWLAALAAAWLWLAFCWLALASWAAFKDALKLAEPALLAAWLALVCAFCLAAEVELVTLLCVELVLCEFAALVEPGIVALVLVARRFFDLLRSRFAPLGVSSALAIVVDPAPKRPATIPIPAKNHCLPFLYIL